MSTHQNIMYAALQHFKLYKDRNLWHTKDRGFWPGRLQGALTHSQYRFYLRSFHVGYLVHDRPSPPQKSDAFPLHRQFVTMALRVAASQVSLCFTVDSVFMIALRESID